MFKRALTTIGRGLMMLAFFTPVTRMAAAQTATAVPRLDFHQFTGTWYEIARYPIKREKRCLGDEMVLYALGDKRDSFQVVTSCKVKDDNSDFWSAKGKMDKAGDGKLKLSRLWPFTSKYWVLATGPAYEWALVGSPNHKSLWILSRTAVSSPALLTELEARAAAQGFNTSRLITIPQHN